MCFSATASFGAGIVLSVIGVATLNKARKASEVFFAIIPLLFSVQQISEGFLWLALANPEYASSRGYPTYTFLFFAQVVWPAIVPFSILQLEKNSQRRKILKLITGMGFLVSAYLGFCLLTYHVEGRIFNLHIDYIQDYPQAISHFGFVLCLVATVASPFLSTVKKMRLIGGAILISYIITAVFYETYVVSVWCFFASVISLSVYVVMTELVNPKDKAPIPGGLQISIGPVNTL